MAPPLVRAARRAPAGPQPTVDRVVVEMGPPAPAPGLDAPGGQVHHLVELVAGEAGERRGPTDQGEEGVDVPLPGGGHLGHDLLGQDVQRGHGRMEQVEVPGPHRRQEGRALDQLVAGERVEATGGRALHVVVGPADALEECGDSPGRADLADQLDRPDVDAQLEGGSGDEGPKVAGPEPLLDDPTARRGEAAVVGGDLESGVDLAARQGDGTLLGAESQGQLVGHPLGHLARVDEDQGGAVLEYVPGDPVEDVGELGAAGHRLQLAVRQFDGHVEVAGVPAVDDGRRGGVVVDARQQTGHDVEWPLGGRQTDALQPSAPFGHQMGQPLQAEGEVRPPFVAGQRVDLVDDDRVDVAQDGARRRRGQQQVQRLGSGDQQVGGRLRMAARSAAGVSPVRTATVSVGGASPMRSASVAMPSSGALRFSSTSTASARRGEMYTTPGPGGGASAARTTVPSDWAR